MTFDAVGFFDPALKILYKSGSSYCDMNMIGSASQISFKKQGQKPEKKNFYFLQSWCPIWSCLPCSEKNKDQLLISHEQCAWIVFVYLVSHNIHCKYIGRKYYDIL